MPHYSLFSLILMLSLTTMVFTTPKSATTAEVKQCKDRFTEMMDLNHRPADWNERTWYYATQRALQGDLYVPWTGQTPHNHCGIDPNRQLAHLEQDTLTSSADRVQVSAYCHDNPDHQFSWSLPLEDGQTKLWVPTNAQSALAKCAVVSVTLIPESTGYYLWTQLRQGRLVRLTKSEEDVLDFHERTKTPIAEIISWNLEYDSLQLSDWGSLFQEPTGEPPASVQQAKEQLWSWSCIEGDVDTGAYEGDGCRCRRRED